jgi:ketosteroid isomerase-like protein
MSDRHDQLKAIVQALYAASGQGDWGRAEAMLTEDFFVTEADHHPFAGVYRGKGALRELYGLLVNGTDIAGFDIQGITVGDDQAVTLVEIILGGPAAERVGLAELMRFRGDQVCEIRPYYFDTAPLRRALRKA